MSEEQAGRLLTGRPVEISVGEPWDFEGPYGPNALRGRIVESLSGAAGEPRLRVEISPFEAGDGRLVSQLTTSWRYADPSGIIEQVAAGKDVDANLSYADQSEDRRLRNGESAFLIGGVRLAKVQQPDTGV